MVRAVKEKKESLVPEQDRRTQSVVSGHGMHRYQGKGLDGVL